MQAAATDDILKELQRLGVLTPAEVVRARTSEEGRTGHTEPAKLLAAAGLTSFQVDTALFGKVERLVLGPYILMNRIAEGGMGTVYQARHSRLGRMIALKVIRSDKLKSKVVARRFLREIRLIASLEHPHIVRAYDAGVIGDKIYLATEFVAGADLASYVRKNGPLPLPDACRMIEQAARALHHIHEHGLVHRDIKPSNLIRSDATGDIKLLDLGLCALPHDGARFDSQSGIITRNGVLLGTPDYISPEQAREPHSVDIRADLYSLGCTFYFLLTGKPPFPGGTPVDKLMKHLFEPAPVLENVPRNVSRLVARLMAKDAADRYANPLALAEAVRKLPDTTDNDTNPFASLIESGEKFVPEAVTEGTSDGDTSRNWFWILGALLTLIVSALLIARNLR